MRQEAKTVAAISVQTPKQYRSSKLVGEQVYNGPSSEVIGWIDDILLEGNQANLLRRRLGRVSGYSGEHLVAIPSSYFTIKGDARHPNRRARHNRTHAAATQGHAGLQFRRRVTFSKYEINSTTSGQPGSFCFLYGWVSTGIGSRWSGRR